MSGDSVPVTGRMTGPDFYCATAVTVHSGGVAIAANPTDNFFDVSLPAGGQVPGPLTVTFQRSGS